MGKRTQRRRHVHSPAEWENLPDEQILQIRIRDLGLRIEGTVLEERINRLYAELDAKGIRLHPPCYLTDEWLTPDGMPIIGVPFVLAHPRLTQLERNIMLEVEGGTDEWCMRLLRHETGHALNYAYLLHKRTRWRELFGAFRTPYRNSYTAAPYSRRYVNHLEDNYAQAHPDEDFAETFAVWLTPGEKWRQIYQRWPALKKLNYVDHLMSQIGSEAPTVVARDTPWSAARMKSTLAAYYERKRRLLGDDFPGFYDPGLQRLFAVRDEGIARQKASRFLRAHRRQIVNSVAVWTGQRKFDVDKLMGKLIPRCEDLELCLRKPPEDTMFDTAAFVTAVMSKIHRFRDGDSKK